MNFAILKYYGKKLIDNPFVVAKFIMINTGISKLISDKKYVELLYFFFYKEKLDLENPKTFNQKLQWLKLNDKKDIHTIMADKYQAKKYVAEVIGKEYVIPTIKVYDCVDDIRYEELPDQFAIKCTHDSGSTFICRNKERFEWKKVKKNLERALSRNYFYRGREWPYKHIKPRIIVEPFLVDSGGGAINDYKFYCFNGKPQFLYVSEGLDEHLTARLSFLTLDWTFAEFRRTDYPDLDELPQKPEAYEDMLRCAEILCKDEKFVRVDFYCIGKQVFFSEFTFYPNGGLVHFEPQEYDLKLGEMLKLDDE
ncbi:MAG: glycosyl transferase [Lachnospiraceae bacterium]|nr:glycosyl transferase [Lachnospiraceae bacterium]